jgi:dTDP-glucose 4,6-dehydratase
MSDAETILVTGGAGFVGSHLVEGLVRAGHQVVNLDLLTYAGNLENLTAVADHPRYHFFHGDIGDRKLVGRILDEFGPALVFNVAAETHVDRSIDDATDFVSANVTGVHRLLESCLDHWGGLSPERRAGFRFVQMSTDEVYGSILEGVFTEASSYAPNSPYAASKAAGDHFVRAYRTTYGLPTIVVHASNGYGPRQHPEKLIPHMVISALNDRALPIYGEGTNVRDWLFVGDLIDGLIRLVAGGRSGEVYDFAGCNERRNIDAVHTICAHLDRLCPAARSHAERITFVPDRPGHDARYAMSVEKVGGTLGWKPRTGWDEGLGATIAWYLDNRSWWQSILARGYRAERIGTRG